MLRVIAAHVQPISYSQPVEPQRRDLGGQILVKLDRIERGDLALDPARAVAGLSHINGIYLVEVQPPAAADEGIELAAGVDNDVGPGQLLQPLLDLGLERVSLILGLAEVRHDLQRAQAISAQIPEQNPPGCYHGDREDGCR